MSEAGLVKVEPGYIVGVDDAISPARLIEQVTLIQNVMKSVMRDGEHFGKIPGCGDKPSLLKPGAEKLCFTFRMDPEFDIEVIDMGKGHREYRVKCTLFAINSGQRLGSGVGSASTMEGKWRFRTGPVESTGRSVPSDYWDQRKSDPVKAQEALGGRGFSTKKIDNVWMIVKQGERIEHDNPADVYNTVLKMGKKRAMVDAVLTCTAASDIFTQDVEELVDNGVIVPTPVAAPATPPPSTPPPAQAPTDAPPATTGEPTQNDVKDQLAIICGKIADALKSDAGTVLYNLTVTKDGKYGKRTIDGIMWEATGPKGLWSPLKAILSKAKDEWKKIEEMNAQPDDPEWIK
jgi:hypothetical protein